MMIALTVLAFGLLAVGPLLYIAGSSSSLSRSKDTATVTAQNKLEYLSALYGNSPSAPDLAIGNHGPQQTEVADPSDEAILNRYSLSWTISSVPDPRPQKAVDAKQVCMTVTPIEAGGTKNYRPAFNKVLTVTTILSPEMP